MGCKCSERRKRELAESQKRELLKKLEKKNKEKEKEKEKKVDLTKKIFI